MASVKDGRTGRQTDHAGDGHAATIPAQGPAQVGTGPRAAHIQQETNQGTYESPHIMSTPLTTQQAVDLYTTMRKIRRFEETVKAHIGKEIVGPAHLYIGEEAVATGVCSNLTHHDYVTSTHRGHGHTLAKGARVDRSLAELYGRATGYCKGKGGSMHLADFSVGMLGANGVVGGGFNIATGAALAIKQRHGSDVAVCFFGDGASSRGTFHEAVNLAASWKLPVIYVCENNAWASTTRFDDIKNVDYLSERAQGYGIPGVTVDGNDVESVRDPPPSSSTAPAAATAPPSWNARPTGATATSSPTRRSTVPGRRSRSGNSTTTRLTGSGARSCSKASSRRTTSTPRRSGSTRSSHRLWNLR